MALQLTLDLPAESRLSRADFCVSPANALALAAVMDWRAWPSGKMVLTGPPGAGKSHLAQIWAADAGAVLLQAADLAKADVADLASSGAVAVEDAETLANDPAIETALFHLHNLLAASGSLLVTALSPPRDWGLTLPDLASRLQSAPLTRLDPPDDTLLEAVLVKLFADRQLDIPANLIPFLITRMDRSIAAARVLVAALDARGLALRRPITRALAAGLFDPWAKD